MTASIPECSPVISVPKPGPLTGFRVVRHTAAVVLSKSERDAVIATGPAIVATFGTNVDLLTSGSALSHIVTEALGLLNTAEVFVTHAGYSSVREALTAGVPMVCLPLFADQPGNAARVEN